MTFDRWRGKLVPDLTNATFSACISLFWLSGGKPNAEYKAVMAAFAVLRADLGHWDASAMFQKNCANCQTLLGGNSHPLIEQNLCK